MSVPPFTILDISQPITSASACFPGDVPFRREITLTHDQSGILNLTAFTMSPHVGTHADAPLHIGGRMEDSADPGWPSSGQMALSPFIGPATVVDLAPWEDLIEPGHLQPLLDRPDPLPSRILVKTTQTIRYDVFEERYSAFSPALVECLGSRGVQLLGIDTPSVDPVTSKTLEAHHRLLKHRMVWLENLDLTQVSSGDYFLVALPLKLLELEASPVRAVLLTGLT